jgi:hypothetical protein
MPKLGAIDFRSIADQAGVWENKLSDAAYEFAQAAQPHESDPSTPHNRMVIT